MAVNNNVDAPTPLLPVVDLSGLGGPQHDEVVEELVKAANSFGFFQVVNHGLSVEFLDELQDATRHFFNQPMEKKMVYGPGVSPSPSVTYGANVVPEDDKMFEWVDKLTLLYNTEEDHQDALAYWPEPCKELVIKYIKTSVALARRILHFLMTSLGVNFDDSGIEMYTALKTLNMNFYPPCPEPELTMGLGRHSDYGTMTVLLQDDVGGLFVKLENDANWVEVEIEPVKGALIIMLGDSLEILSNGEYQSPEHWVRSSGTKSRISIPLFLGPSLTTNVGPLPEVAEKDGGARYEESVYGEYIERAYMQLGRGKAFLNSTKIAQSQ